MRVEVHLQLSKIAISIRPYGLAFAAGQKQVWLAYKIGSLQVTSIMGGTK